MDQKSRGRPAVVDAVLRVVAERGIEAATVRQVAGEAGVAIGTVQHWFPTKDDLLVGAFEEVVDRVRRRVGGLELGADGRANLSLVLRELLPLDEARHRECRVQVAFAARAVVEPRLAELQAAVLADVRRALAEGYALALGVGTESATCTQAATTTLALVDGLALHAVSSGPGGLTIDDLLAAVEAHLDGQIVGTAHA